MEKTKHPNNVEVLTVEVKGENFSKAKLRCLETGEESWHGFYRKTYKPKPGQSPQTDAERLVVEGAQLRVEYLYQDGRVKDKETGEKWPGGFNIKDVEPISATAADAREVFNDDRPAPRQVGAFTDRDKQITDRDKSIIAQVAWKCAAQLGAVHYNAVGEKDFDINVVGKWAREIATDIQSMSKDPFLWDD